MLKGGPFAMSPGFIQDSLDAREQDGALAGVVLAFRTLAGY